MRAKRKKVTKMEKGINKAIKKKKKIESNEMKKERWYIKKC